MGAHPSRLRYANQPTKVAAALPHLPEQVVRVLRLCDGTRSRAMLNEDSGLPVSLLDRVLGKLEQDGLVQRMERRCEALTALPMSALDWLHGRRELVDIRPLCIVEDFETIPDFTYDEEDFFAQSIDHLLEPEERYAD